MDFLTPCVKRRFSACGLLGLWLCLAPAYAQPLVTASHALLDSLDQGNGVYAVTLAVTVTNHGAEPLYDTTLTLLPDRWLLLLEPLESPLVVGDVFAGETVTVDWTFNAASPGELLEPLLPFHGENLTASGEPAVFGVTSEQEVTP